jgi:hypothetical protein
MNYSIRKAYEQAGYGLDKPTYLRKPQRITFTAHWQLHQRLQQRADAEGRSLSNLISHLLEVSTS